jgi:HEAT repeat protein
MRFLVSLLFLTALFTRPVAATPQATFEQVTGELNSPNAAVRLKAAELLREAAYPEAALPVAALITDPKDDVQLAAIGAELNIFLADKVVPRKRIGLLIEVRTAIAADAAFSGGPLLLGPLPVPPEVLAALRAGARDDNPRVALESLYAFGTLAGGAAGPARTELRRTSQSDLAGMVGAPDPAFRYAAIRVIGGVYGWRRADPPADQVVGDAVITALNDRDRTVRAAAMQTLGAMRYERSVQALSDLFTYYGKGTMAEGALDALAHIANPSTSALFESLLAGRSAAMKGIAIEGLARIGDTMKWPDIEAAVKTERDAGIQLAGRFAAATLSGGAIGPIAAGLTTARLRDQARQYLIELAFGRADAFAPYAADPDPHVRLEAVEILAIAADPAALPILEPLATDSDPRVARAADRAVARLRAVKSPAP